MFRSSLVIVISVLVLSFTILAQDRSDNVEINRQVLDKHEPGTANPFGTLNPNAPAEVAQFEFMVGVFDCIDEIRNPADGKWYESKSVWSSSYFLNGYGIQDKYWSPITVASGTRLFDQKKKKWIVNYFQSQPRYSTGVWEGRKEGDNMVMRQQNGTVESRLTFSNITKNSFNWIGERVDGESVSSGWKISCKRRK